MNSQADMVNMLKHVEERRTAPLPTCFSMFRITNTEFIRWLQRERFAKSFYILNLVISRQLI